MRTLSASAKLGLFVAFLGHSLFTLYLALEVYKVDPARHGMYEEALKAVGRGDALCAEEGLASNVREVRCYWVYLQNRDIIADTISSGRRR